MKIAFAHNLQVTSSEDEAEFDTPETVAAISQALRNLGHEVEVVEVSGAVSKLVARLEAMAPDLVFNTAEGWIGRFREAFFPALFEQLGLRFTGSDAYACTTTLDKHLSKVLVQRAGVRTPRWSFVEGPEDAIDPEMRFPLFIKPNFEGSSKGITADSIVPDAETLKRRLADLLERFPEGVLVEEYIEGRDVVVPYLEKASPQTGGVLPSAEYEIAGGSRKIYDYALKHEDSDSVQVRTPANFPEAVQAELQRLSRIVYRALDIRGLGRIDYRITADGEIYFIEVNALPSLEPGAAIYESARAVGLETVESVLEVVIEAAMEQPAPELPERAQQARRTEEEKLRVGLIFNQKRVVASADGTNDQDAEYDSPKTIAALSDAIASYGFEVVPLEAGRSLLSRLEDAELDLAFNIAEGLRGRGRESVVPAMLDLLDIPYTGSDPTTMSLALDKGLAKRVVAAAGVATPRHAVLTRPEGKLPEGFRYPAIVKPVAEGSSKGVLEKSVAHSEEELRELAGRVIARYEQGALVEEFLPGREFTIGVLGELEPRALPPMEIVFENAGETPIYTFAHKLDTSDEVRYEAPAKVDPELAAELESVALTAFEALGCRDVARIDVRLDAEGRVNFIECNPLPGLTPDWSDLCLIANAAGLDYRSLVGEILSPALRRLRVKQAGGE